MEKVFFSYAHEDKSIVEHIYGQFVIQYSDVQPWLDKYEILGGESLTQQVAEGINNANKFVIFLSPTSILKPWVNRELRKALAEEIKRNNAFIIPVVLGELPKVPDFLEDKLYLDMRGMTEAEFMRSLYAAIRGLRGSGASDSAQLQNLRVAAVEDTPKNIVQVQISAQYWAEEMAFEIEMSKPFNAVHFFFTRTGTFIAGPMEEEADGSIFRLVAVERKVTPDNKLVINFTFDTLEGAHLVEVRKWPEGFKRPMKTIIRA